MDGDSPVEWCHVLTSMAGAYKERCDYDKPRAEFKAALETRQAMLLARVNKEVDPQSRAIGAQVLGVLMLNQGATMLTAVKDAVMAACSADEWASRDLERRIYVSDFRRIVESQFALGGACEPAREYDDWTKKYGVSQDDLDRPRTSGKVLNVAMCEIAEHLKCKPWFRGVHFAVNDAGYSMLLLLDEKDVEAGAKDILHDNDVPPALFEIPVSFYVMGQVTVAKRGDKIFED
jgi:hypothetical protein